MDKPTQRLYTADQVRELDRIAIEESGADGYQLMRRAGLAAFRALRYQFPTARRLGVFCGSGNNGGDGYVVAALALRAGLAVGLVALGSPKTDAARRARADFEAAGGQVAAFDAGTRPDAEVLVDALLGTGLARPPSGDYGRAIEQINGSQRPVLALDIVSGLHADTGSALQPCIVADATATFIGRKLGCHTGDGPAVSGRLYLDGLGVPDTVHERMTAAAGLVDPRPPARRIGRRRADMHKGQAGRVLIAGGNDGMSGAPCLAARAAHVSGAGLVQLATRARPESLVINSLESMAAHIESAADLEPLLEPADVVAVGPGLGRDDWAIELWDRLLACDRPLVVDADALALLASRPVYRDDWILTPHAGEAARLLGTSAQAVQQDRPAAVHSIVDKYGGVAVLKGAGTLVAGAELRVCNRGNAGMASAGMGDTLTGVIAALLAQGLRPEAAAGYGVWCHALAGDRAARQGQAGVTASALTAQLQGIVGVQEALD